MGYLASLFPILWKLLFAARTIDFVLTYILITCTCHIDAQLRYNMLNTRLSTRLQPFGSAGDSRRVSTPQTRHSRSPRLASPDAAINRALLVESVMSAAGLRRCIFDNDCGENKYDTITTSIELVIQGSFLCSRSWKSIPPSRHISLRLRISLRRAKSASGVTSRSAFKMLRPD